MITENRLILEHWPNKFQQDMENMQLRRHRKEHRDDTETLI